MLDQMTVWWGERSDSHYTITDMHTLQWEVLTIELQAMEFIDG
jgi:hypothetical protein